MGSRDGNHCPELGGHRAGSQSLSDLTTPASACVTHVEGRLQGPGFYGLVCVALPPLQRAWPQSRGQGLVTRSTRLGCLPGRGKGFPYRLHPPEALGQAWVPRICSLPSGIPGSGNRLLIARGRHIINK